MGGSKWDPVNGLTGSGNAFDTLGTSTARYGCCPANKYMSSPEGTGTFDEADSCSACPAGTKISSLTSVPNDEISCQLCERGKSSNAVSADVGTGTTGVLTESEAIASGAWVNSGKALYAKSVIYSGQVANHNGQSGVQTVSNVPVWEMFESDGTFFNRLGWIQKVGSSAGQAADFVFPTTAHITNGDEFWLDGNYAMIMAGNASCDLTTIKLPDGNGKHLAADRIGNTLERIVDDILGMDSDKKEVATTTYGPIENWDMTEVTNMKYLFYQKGLFNSDLSSWDVSGVTTMKATFESASAFNSDLSKWAVSSVTNMKHST